MGLWKNRQDAADEEAAKAAKSPGPATSTSPRTRARRTVGGGDMANIGKSISIKGDVEGGEDTVI